MNTTTLLPDPSRFRLEYIAGAAHTVTLLVTSLQTTVHCPLCDCAAAGVHSWYHRTLADMPWNQVAIRMHLSVRKFFCGNPLCARVIFTEPLPGFAARYARKTLRLNEVFYLIGYALGGEAGARVAEGLGLSTSPDTLLNRVRQAANVSAAEEEQDVSELGVDDFAFRKGQRYGTILVDLVRRRVLDLLPDRTAESLAAWLKAHPSVKIVSRDRASAYSEGAREGAPQAKQVADRWHLLKNTGDMLERLLTRHYKHLRETTRQLRAAPKQTAPPPAQQAQPPEPNPDTTDLSRPQTRAQHDSACRRERRLNRYEQVRELHRQKLSVRAIARKTGLSRNTLRKWLDADGFREQAKPPPRKSKIAPFSSYLKKRWEEGIDNAALLFEEIKAQGFEGSMDLVQRHVLPWRQAARGQPRPHREEPPSARTVTWWLLGHVSKDAELRQKQTAFVEQLCQLCPDVKTAQELALRFTGMVKERRAEEFTQWLDAATNSNIAELKGFARCLRQDFAAVEAALSCEVSNGQTEGQVNRLKFVKRQMYGRAGFDLLKARVLPIQKAA